MCCHPRRSILMTNRDLIRTVIFSRYDFICSIRYRDMIRNQRYLNVRMYRICEYYDVNVSYFRLSYDIIFNIYNKNDIFEPK